MRDAHFIEQADSRLATALPAKTVVAAGQLVTFVVADFTSGDVATTVLVGINAVSPGCL